MSKKKWLAVIVAAFTVVYLVYRANYIPIFTEKVNYAFYLLTGTYNTSPLAIVSAAGAAVTGVGTAIKLVWDRTKTGITETNSLIMEEKNRQIDAFNNDYATLKNQAKTLQGQLTATQSELTAIKATLTDTQKQLATANTIIQRRQDVINAYGDVKARELNMAKTIVKLQDAMKEIPGATPQAVKRIMESCGFEVVTE